MAAPRTEERPPGEAGPGRRARTRDWARDLSIGIRFALTGGRQGWFRTLLTGFGVALGVAVLLLAASYPEMADARGERSAARAGDVVGTQPAADTALHLKVETPYRGEEVNGTLLSPDGDRLPVPPGLDRLPALGEMAVSPALARLLDSPEGELLAARLPYRVVDTIGEAGLLSPGELAYVAVRDDLVATAATERINGFHGHTFHPSPDPVETALLVVICTVLLLPVAALIFTAVRLGGERRNRRLAALRLVGADIPMTHRIAAGEALAGALLGVLFGVLLFLAGRRTMAGTELFGHTAFVSDITPEPLLAALILAAVPVTAVLITQQALRRVSIEPLGVVREAVTVRRRLLWRLLVPAAGLALLVPALGGIDTEASRFTVWQVGAGTVLLLTGVVALLPWLLEALIRRLGRGPVSWQLAVRRMQLDSGPASRSVSAVTLVVAGAIAAQLLIAGVDEGERTAQADATTAAPKTAHAVLHAEVLDADRAGPALDALGALPGTETHVLRVDLLHNSGALTSGEPPQDEAALVIAGCATLHKVFRVGDGTDDCTDGDVFLLPPSDARGWEDARPVTAGTEFEVSPTQWYELEYTDEGELTEGREEVPRWTVPADARALEVPPARQAGFYRGAVLATPGVFDPALLTHSGYDIRAWFDPADRDAPERLVNAATLFGPGVTVVKDGMPADSSGEYAGIEQALTAGTVAVLWLIGLAMLIATAEQLREHRRQMAALVACGTTRGILSRSLLWQTALPMVLGLVLAVAGGLGLGAVLLGVFSHSAPVDWAQVALLSGMGALVVVVVTALSLPLLWRLIRPSGLRTE
jgi:hypothetical protein